MKLANQVAIVTGAGRNIGEDVSKLLAQNGASIAVVDLDRARGEKVAADIVEISATAARHGRTLGFGISTQVLCAPTDAQAEGLAADLERQAGSNVAARALGAGLVGSPARIAQRIKRWEQAGVTCLMLQFHPTMDGLETFAREVMPLLR